MFQPPVIVWAQDATLYTGSDNSFQPEIIETGNGVPLINIVTPNDTGLSHNKYDQFNVGENGTIFNNSTEELSLSQLGGLVQGNGNLTVSGSASIILNEVLGGSRSSLEGFLEVHGAGADVIFSNAYGITCNGCGFINMPRAVLTTGTPGFDSDGSLSSLNVDQGDVLIGARGLDASAVNLLDIVSRTTKFEGIVKAQEARISAGRNQFNYGTGLVTTLSSDGSESEYGIDSSLLGGMYANKITMISTDQGTGVRAPKKMASHTGQMTITSDGRLVLGSAQAKGDINIKSAQGDIVAEDHIYSDSSVRLEAAGAVDVNSDKMVVAQADLDVLASNIHLNSGSVFASGVNADGQQVTSGSMLLSASQNLLLKDAKVSSGGVLTVNADQLDISRTEIAENSNFASQGAMILNVGSIADQNSQVESGDNLSILSDNGLILNGQYQALGEFDLTSANLSILGGVKANDTVKLTTTSGDFVHSGSIVSGQDTVLDLAGSLTINGDALVMAKEKLDFEAVNFINHGDVSAHGQGFDLALSGDLTNTGLLASDGSIDFNIDGTVKNDGGSIITDGVLSLSSIDDGHSGAFSNLGDGWIEGASIDLSVLSLTHEGTLLASGGSFEASVDGSVVSEGTISASGSLTLESSGSVTLEGSEVSTGEDLVLSGLNGGSSGLLSIDEASKLLGDEEVSITASGLDNSGQVGSSGGSLNVTVDGSLTNSGMLYGDSALVAHVSGDVTNSGGYLVSKGDVTFDGGMGQSLGDFTNKSGRVQGGSVSIHASSLDHDGLLKASSDQLTLMISGDVTGTGSMVSAGDFALKADGSVTLTDHELISLGSVGISGLSGDKSGAVSVIGSDSRVEGSKVTIEGSSLDQAGSFVSVSGDLWVGVSGHLTTQGTVQSAGKLDLLSDGSVRLEGSEVSSVGRLVVDGYAGSLSGSVSIDETSKLLGEGGLTVESSSLVNLGQLGSKFGLSRLLVTGNFDHEGTFYARDDLTLAVDGTVKNDGGSIITDGVLSLSSIDDGHSGAFSNLGDGWIEGASIDLSVLSLTHEGTLLASGGSFEGSVDSAVISEGTISASGSLTLESSGSVTLEGSEVSTGEDLVLSGLNGGSSGLLSIDEASKLLGDEGVSITASGLDNSGQVGSSGGSLDVTVDGSLTNSGMLYGDSALVAHVSGDVTNSGGYLVSKGDVTFDGGTGQALGDFTNESGRVESYDGGDITIIATSLLNKKETFEVEQIVETSTSTSGSTTTTTTVTTDVISADSTESRIQTDGNIIIEADTITNSHSLIASGGDITLTGTDIVNEGQDLLKHTDVVKTVRTQYRECRRFLFWKSCSNKTRITTTTDPRETETVDFSPSSITAGGTVNATVTGYLDNNAVRSGGVVSSQTSIDLSERQETESNTANLDDASVEQSSSEEVESSEVALATKEVIDSGMALMPTLSELDFNRNLDGFLEAGPVFSPTEDPEASFLVETRSAFIDPSEFLGSDYYMNKLTEMNGYDMDMSIQRFGDAFVETQLVEQQIFDLTGDRVLEQGVDLNDQIKNLYDNAVEQGQALDIAFGVALSSEQISKLTSDIIWLETQIINGQEVLTPRVYLASTTADNVDFNSAKILGASVNITATGGEGDDVQVQNSGQISGEQDLTIDSEGGIQNRGGTLESEGDINIESDTFVHNQSGTISGDDVSITADQIELETLTTRRDNFNGFTDTVEQAGRIDAKGDITLDATGDITSKGGQISADGQVSLNADGDISLDVQKVETKRDDTFSSGYDRSYDQTNVVSSITSGGDTVISSASDITSVGSQVSAEGELNIEAAGDVKVEAAREIHEQSSKLVIKESGLFSSTTTTTTESSSSNTVVENAFASSGGDVVIKSGEDTGLSGIVSAEEDIRVEADGNIEITASKDYFSEDSSVVEETSGLFSSGGFSITLGSQTLEAENSADAIIHKDALLLAGNDINLDADKTLEAEGTSVAGGGSVTLTGQEIDIRTAEDEFNSETRTAMETTGLTVSLDGGIVDQLKSLDEIAERLETANSDKLKTALAIKGLKELNELSADVMTFDKDDPLEGMSVSISLGTSKTETETSETSTVNQASTISGDTVSLTSTEGDITLTGSEVTGETSVTLDATDDVVIESATDTRDFDSETETSSASIGISIDLGKDSTGINVNASVSGSEIDIEADQVTHVDSKVTGETVTIISGDDATIAGGQVTGDTVVVDVGGDLEIESRQDIDNYNEESDSFSAGGSVSLTGGGGSLNVSVSEGEIDSEYASVDEQSGIFAGEGGFDVDVEGNTDLHGGAIVSEAEEGENSLTTGSLTFDDVENKAEFSSESTTVGVGIGSDGISPSVSPGFGAEGEDSTETLATVSDAEVTIGGEVAGEDELAGLNRDADTAHEKLDTIFDLEKIKEDAEYAKIASEIVGDVTAPLLKMIGEKYGKGEIDAATHKFMHALVGCGTGAITGGDCASGATGAVVAELAAELAVHVQTKALADKIKAGGELSPEDFETIVNNAELVGKFASLGVALGLDLNDHSANEAAVNAVENNCGQGLCVAMAVTLLVAYLTTEGDGNSGEGLTKIGRGEDTLSQGVAWAAGETVKLSMEHYPDQTTAVLSGLETIGEAADVAIEYVDESTGEIVSTTWGAIPETIRDQLVGAGKIISVVIPPAKVGKLKDLAKTGKISDIDFPDGNATNSVPERILVRIDGAGNSVVSIHGREMSIHASQQATTRGISNESIAGAMDQTPFQYRQNGDILDGFYDPATNTFVGVGDRITTVIRPRNPENYLNNLRNRQ